MSKDHLQIDAVHHWEGSRAPLPEQLQGDGPWLLTLADLKSLMEDHDVMLVCLEDGPSKRGAPRRVLWIDRPRGRFRQR